LLIPFSCLPDTESKFVSDTFIPCVN